MKSSFCLGMGEGYVCRIQMRGVGLGGKSSNSPEVNRLFVFKKSMGWRLKF